MSFRHGQHYFNRMPIESDGLTETGDTSHENGARLPCHHFSRNNPPVPETLWLMARGARIVIPGWPHHVTQRGNHRQRVFFSDQDRILYLDLMGRYFSIYELSLIGHSLTSTMSTFPQRRRRSRSAWAG